MLKICIGLCKLEKEENEQNFCWRNDILKFRNECKICRKIKTDKSDKKYKINNKEKLNEKSKINSKKRREKYPDKVRESNARYIKNHSEKVKKAQKKRWKIYYAKNSAIIQNKNKNYKENNNEKIKKQRNDRRKNDIKYRLKSFVSCFVRQSLKENGSCKNKSSSLKYVNVDKLKLHLEKQFENWQNWDNHGNYEPKTWDDSDKSTWKWQIDHIIPQSEFYFTSMEDDNFKKCWALENLRPYPAKYNIQEKNRKNKLKFNNVIFNDWEYINDPNSHYRYNVLNKKDYIKLSYDNNKKVWVSGVSDDLGFLKNISNIESPILDEAKSIIDRVIKL